MKNYFLKLLYYLPICLLFIACEDKEIENQPQEQVAFKFIGLPNRIVYELTYQDSKLYAATDNGVYVRQNPTGSSWQELGLQGQKVKTILFLPDGTCLASVVDPSKPEFKLYRASNNTFSFELVPSNFGGADPEPINNMAYNAATNEIYGVGYNVLAKSTDKGLTWEPVYNDWHYLASGLDFVRLSPLTGDIWAGGQNGIEGFNLIKYSKATNQWQTWQNLIESPSTAKDLAFDKNNSNRLIIGGEDGIIQTQDNGTTWTTLKHESHAGRFYFGVDFDQDNSNIIYATSWLKNFDDPQPLILYVSENGGTSWKEYKYADDQLFGGVWDMVQMKEGETTKLFLGLYKGGVFEVTLK